MSFESLQSFLLFLAVMKKFEEDPCKKNIQIRKDKMAIDRIVGGAPWDNANRMTPLRLFICQMGPKAFADDDERLDSEKSMWWPHQKVSGIVKTVCLRNRS